MAQQRRAAGAVPCDTRCLDAAFTQLRADGFEVRDEDVARLSPFVRHHVNAPGHYSFRLPDLPGGLRPLRAPDTGTLRDLRTLLRLGRMAATHARECD